MEKDVLIKEIMWEYNYSKQHAEKLVQMYIDMDKYEDLCGLIIAKKNISIEVQYDV